ncbi:MAG: hypothetical protein Q8L93_11715 [Rhodocyclaceae bacterium]|nr:hypothetical protein [Rhodocyclaceae bacterium]
MRTQPDPGTVTLHLPVLDDAAAVMIYNCLCELVDRFDTHYGEQICRFYSQQQRANNRSPPTNNPDDSPF